MEFDKEILEIKAQFEQDVAKFESECNIKIKKV